MPGAARIGDQHMCPAGGGPVTGPGESSVMIDGRPALVVGAACTCMGPPDTVAKGSSTVFIGGKPVARQGDPTTSGGTITTGSPTVMIGG